MRGNGEKGEREGRGKKKKEKRRLKNRKIEKGKMKP